MDQIKDMVILHIHNTMQDWFTLNMGALTWVSIIRAQGLAFPKNSPPTFILWLLFLVWLNPRPSPVIQVRFIKSVPSFGGNQPLQSTELKWSVSVYSNGSEVCVRKMRYRDFINGSINNMHHATHVSLSYWESKWTDQMDATDIPSQAAEHAYVRGGQDALWFGATELGKVSVYELTQAMTRPL